MLLSPRLQPVAVGWVLFAGLLVLPLVGYRLQPFRNLLSLVPLLCIAAAVLLASPSVMRGALQRSHVPAVAMTMIAAAISIKAFNVSSRYMRDRVAHTDSRVQAIDWLAAHTRAGERVLALRELVFLPAELARIQAQVREVSILAGAPRFAPERTDYIVDADVERTDFGDPDMLKRFDEFKTAVAGLPIVANFGTDPTPLLPALWRGWNHRVIIRRAE
jgi:hypothetical protein